MYRTIHEDEWQDTVIKACRSYRFRVMGMRKSSREIGGKWVSNLLGDGKGWPDIVAFEESEPHRMFAFELKREGEKATPEQVSWLQRLDACGFKSYVLRPSDVDKLTQLLEGEEWEA